MLFSSMSIPVVKLNKYIGIQVHNACCCKASTVYFLEFSSTLLLVLNKKKRIIKMYVITIFYANKYTDEYY